jgi:hypothetical protein
VIVVLDTNVWILVLGAYKGARILSPAEFISGG